MKAKLFEISGAWGLPNAVKMRKTGVSELCAETNMADGDLHEQAQRPDALDASTLDEGTRRSLLLAISYYASCVSARNSNYSNEELEAVLNHYNSTIRFVNGCSEINKAVFTACVDEMFSYTIGESRFPMDVSQVQKVAFFAAYAVLMGGSYWQGKGHNLPCTVCVHIRGRVFQSLKEIIPSLVSTSVVENLLSALLAESDPSVIKSDHYSEMLLHLLETHAELNSDGLARICTILYEDTIATGDIDRIEYVLAGPNGAAFRNYIMNSFRQSCTDGMAKYFFCAAAITNQERSKSEACPFEETFTRMIDAQDADSYLLNAACLSMTLWYPPRFRPEILGQRARVKARLEDEQVREKLLKYLRKPDGVFYPITASLVADLVPSNLLDEEILDEGIFQTALGLLSDEALRKYAEWILTLIPLGKFHFAADSTHRQAFQATLQEQYALALQNVPKYRYPEYHFAALCHLGVWPNANQRMEQLDRILDFYNEYYEGGWRDSEWRMQHLLKQSLPGPLLWELHNSDVDPMMLNASLCPERYESIIGLAKEFCRNRADTVTITSVEEALDVIRFFKFSEAVCAPTPQEAKNLLENIRLDVRDAGSFIVLSWFQLLCAFDCGNAALDLYGKYAHILSMPWLDRLSMLETWNGDSPGAYCRYRELRSRLQVVLAESLQEGHYEVFRAFMGSSYRPELDNKRYAQYLNRKITDGAAAKLVADAFHGKYNTDANARRLAKQASRSEEPADNSHGEMARILRLLAELDELNSDDDHTEKPEQIRRQNDSTFLPYLSVIDSGLHFNPAVFYDDLTVMEFIIRNHPEQCGEVLRVGYGNYKPIALEAVTANPDRFIDVSLQLQRDLDICKAAHRDPEDPYEWLKQRLALSDSHPD